MVRRPRLPTGRRFLLGILLLGLQAGCVSTPPGAMVGIAGRPPASLPDDAYLLPFAAGTRHTCIQAGPGPFSHDGPMRYAVDFAMPVGTPVVAARGGTVSAVKEDSDRGGASKSLCREGNFVVIRHADGTQAVYLHLQKDGALVDVGQEVARGQVIGRSGNTGWSAMPHLHFQVDRLDGRQGRWKSISVPFADIEGDGRPGMLTTYESGNRPPVARGVGEPVR